MMKLLVVPLLGALCGPAVALDRLSAPELCDTVKTLSVRVTKLTGYSLGNVCPDISFTLPAVPVGQVGLLGSYHPEDKSIRLAANLDLSTVYGRSILLHELVHAAQDRAGFLPTCRARMELAAYTAQSEYLRAHAQDHQAEAALFLADTLSRCDSGQN